MLRLFFREETFIAMTDRDVLQKSFTGRIVAYQADLAKALGSVTTGLFLSQILYWSDKGDDAQGWIYKTQAAIHEETGLGRREQETARKVLRRARVLHEERRGIPARMFFKIDFDVLCNLLQQYYESKSGLESLAKSSMADSAILERQNPPNRDGAISQSTKTGSAIHTKAKITPEITSESMQQQQPGRDQSSVVDHPTGKHVAAGSGSDFFTSKVLDQRKAPPDVVGSSADKLTTKQQQLVEYAAAKGIDLPYAYAVSYLSRAGCLASARTMMDEAAAFIAREHARGKSIDTPIGVLEHVLRCEHGVRLTHDPISKRQKRIEEKEAKYADLYLS
jgi:hypothetical protein